MCGRVWALAFTPSNFRVTAPYLTLMRDTMTHHGPLWGAQYQ